MQEFLERLRGAAADGEAQGEPAESSASATLLARVLDNVQMTICNLHVRYEDRMNAGGPCALGMRLAAVHVRSRRCAAPTHCCCTRGATPSSSP